MAGVESLERAESGSSLTRGASTSSVARTVSGSPTRNSSRHNVDLRHSAKVNSYVQKYNSTQKVASSEIDIGCLLDRLQLERQLFVAVRKLVIFLVIFVCFMNSLSAVQPAHEIGRAQRHLETHFGLGAASSISDFQTLYNFVETFGRKSAALQPESGQYWCERQHLRHAWNQSSKVGLKSCAAPLGPDPITTGGGVLRTFDRVRNFDGAQVALSAAMVYQTRWKSKSCVGFASNYNRLASAPIVANVTVYSVHAAKIISGATLATEVLTLAAAKARCIALEGCAGFMLPGSSMNMPASVTFMGGNSSTPSSSWTSFKKEYVIQSAPGQRLEDSLSCAERLERSDEAYATKDLGSSNASVTRRNNFRDSMIYPEVLLRNGKDLPKLRQLGWLDSLTESISLGTIVYTEHMEVFTFVTVKFAVNNAGGLVPEVHLFSYKDNDGMDSTLFFIWTGIAVFAAVVLIAWSLLTLSRIPSSMWMTTCQAVLFELAVATALCGMLLIIGYSWSAQDDNAQAIFDLITKDVTHTGRWQLSPDSPGNSTQKDELLASFFTAADKILDRTSHLFQIRIASYVMMHLLFLQVIICFRTHPKMQSVVDVAFRGFTELLNFFVLFIPLFLTMAAMAHWSFGPYIDDYRTYSATLSLQIRRIFGEILVDAGVESRLPFQQLIVCWIYTFTMWLAFFWALVYILAALVIDSFRTAKADEKSLGSFVTDVIDTVSLVLKAWSGKLPWSADMMNVIADLQPRAVKGKVAFNSFARHQMLSKHTYADITALLAAYNTKSGGALLITTEAFFEPSSRKSREPSQAKEALPPMSEAAPLPPVVHEEPAGRDQSKDAPIYTEVPYLMTVTQRTIHQEVEKLVQNRLREAQKIGEDVDWEHLAADLAHAAVNEVQQVLIRKFAAPSDDGNKAVGDRVPPPIRQDLSPEPPEGASTGMFDSPGAIIPGRIAEEDDSDGSGEEV